MKQYSIIFTTGYTDDIDSLTQQLKCDVLILDEEGNYYNPQFITLERINGVFVEKNTCFLEDNLVIMHSITKNSILESIKVLHNWMFFKRWRHLTKEQLEKYFYPTDDWLSIPVNIE